MSVRVIGAEAWARAMQQLLPPGRLWRRGAGTLYGTFLAAGDELERLSQRAADLVEEADPRVTTELISDFESMLGLDGTGTIAERRARVVGRLVTRQRRRPADYKQFMSEILGLSSDDVEVVEITAAEAAAAADAALKYQYYVYRDPNLAGSYDLDDAQALLTEADPAVKNGIVVESLLFKADDPYSLTDRDPLGHPAETLTFLLKEVEYLLIETIEECSTEKMIKIL